MSNTFEITKHETACGKLRVQRIKVVVAKLISVKPDLKDVQLWAADYDDLRAGQLRSGHQQQHMTCLGVLLLRFSE